MAELWLLCEGDSDAPVLDAVLTGVLGAGIVVKSTGGVSNAPSAVATLDEAARLVTKSGEAAVSPHLAPAAVGARYDDELARLQNADYLTELRFLEEFHGRDLLAELEAWLRREHRAQLSRKIFLQELVKAVPVAYRANRSLYGTDDFLDLANGVRALAGEPPIS